MSVLDMKLLYERLTLSQLRWCVAVLSVFISLWSYGTNDIVNRDGVVYLFTAQHIAEEGLRATLDYYSWLFYPLLILWVQQIFSFGYEISAYCVNTLLWLVLADSFVRLVYFLKEDIHIATLSSVLFLSFSELNEYHDFIIRDVGYWAFLMLATVHYVRLFKEFSIINATLFFLSAVVAFLFRFEGIMVLAFSVGMYALHCVVISKQLLVKYKVMLLIILSVLVGALTWGLFLAEQAGLKIGDIAKYLIQWKDVWALTNEKFSSSVLNKLSEEYSAVILFSGLAGLVIYKLIQATGLYFILLSAVSLKSGVRVKFDESPQYVMLIALCSVAIVYAFVTYQLFTSTRYIMPAVLLFATVLTIYIASYLQLLIKGKKKGALALVAVLLLISFVDGLTSTGESKAYVKAAGLWAAENLKDKKIASNDLVLSYYSDSKLVEGYALNEIRVYEYALLRYRAGRESEQAVRALIKKHNFTIERVFSAEKKHPIILAKRVP